MNPIKIMKEEYEKRLEETLKIIPLDNEDKVWQEGRIHTFRTIIMELEEMLK